MANKQSNASRASTINIAGNVNDSTIHVGDTIKTGYTSKEVSALITQITSTFQPKPFDGTCPYMGLDVFEEGDAELFFGREKLVEELVSKVKASRTVFITGPSGSGKSSLVRAGLIPSLKQGKLKGSDRWLYATMKPGRDPFEALAIAFSRLKSPELGNYFREHSHQPAALNECAESALSEYKDQRLVLFIDQFEEVFTQINQEEERVAFLNLLTHATDSENGRVILLFSMRSDFLLNCAVYPKLNATLNRQFIQIGAMQADELVSAIAQPALRVGLRIDPDLIAQIINDMKGEPGALPLMSFALKDLFDKEQAKGGMIALTLNGYFENKGINEALQRHADAALAQLSEHEKKLAQSIFSNLIEIGRGTQDTKRTAPFIELVPADSKADEVQAVVQKLADARLVTTEEENEEFTITHEKLIDAWPWLKKLINENRETITLQNEIASAAKEWEENKRDASYLYSGGRLANIWEQVQKQKLTLGQLAQEFVKAGRRRQQKTRAALVSGVSIILIAAIVASLVFQNQAQANIAIANTAQAASTFAIEQQYLGLANANEAQKQFQIARAGELAAQAQSLRQDDLQLSLLMSVEAYHKFDIFQTRKLLLSSSQTPIELIGFYGQQGSSYSGASVTISPDGKIIATGGSGEQIMLWNTESRNLISSVPAIDNGLIRNLAFSPDGRILAIAQNNSIHLWDIVTTSQLAILYSDAPLIDHIAFSPDGKVLAASDNYRGISFWDVETIKFLDFLPLSMDIVGAHIAFSSDGKWFIAVYTECDYSKNPTKCNPKTLFFDSQSLELKLQFDGTIGRAFDISISADSKLLAISGEKGVDILDISKDPITLKSFNQYNVRSLSFSPDGKTLALGGEKITFLNLESFVEDEQSLIGHSGLVTDILYTPNGKKLISGGCNFNAIYNFPDCDKGETILWNLENSNPIITSIPAFYPTDSTILQTNTAQNYLVLSQVEKTILWDANQNKQIGILDGCKQNRFEIFFAKDGGFVACSTNNNRINIWKTSPFQLITTIPITGIENLSVNHDKTLLSIRLTDKIILWDILKEETTGDSISIEDGQWINNVVFSPDGKYIATGSCNTKNIQTYCEPKILIWEVKTQKLVYELVLTGQGGTIRALAFSPDGKYLVSGSGGNGVQGGDVNIIFWNLETGQQIGQSLKPSDGAMGDIWGLAFNPNGSVLASNDEARGIILWDTSNYQPIFQYKFDHIITNGDISFTKDGNLLIFDSEKTLMFNLSPDDWLNILCERASRNFTHAEWTQYFPGEEYRKTCEQWPLEPEITPTTTQ